MFELIKNLDNPIGELAISMILGYLPQSASYIIFVYAAAKEKMEKKTFWLSLLIFSVATLLIRSLPISFGVHSILNLITLISLTLFLNHIKVTTAFLGSIIATVFLSMLEIVFLLFAKLYNPVLLTYVNSSPLMKAITCLPINIMFLVTALVAYYITTRKVGSRATDRK